jgi:hypothetical protein
MYSTTYISKYTPAVLQMLCKQKGVTAETLRLGTLKRVECELANFLSNSASPLHGDDREALEDLHRAVRLAIGEE